MNWWRFFAGDAPDRARPTLNAYTPPELALHSTLMSRGSGTTMRRLEAALTAEWQPIATLAANVYAAPTPTRAHVEASRRAAKRLADLDRAEVQLHHRNTVNVGGADGYWTRERRLLVARRPLTPEEHEHEQEAQRQEQAAWRARMDAHWAKRDAAQAARTPDSFDRAPTDTRDGASQKRRGDRHPRDAA